jgi:glutamate dehydrogenase/leucine dehydrogenase
MPLIQFLFEAGVKKVIASDIDRHRESEIKQTFASAGHDFELRIVGKNDLSILSLLVDAVCPCATGGILNSTTIPSIQSKIVCGAANNQLLEMTQDNIRLASRGILYIPDFLANRMGIVNCADEFAGVFGSGEEDPKLALHLGNTWENSIYLLTKSILKESDETGKTPQEIALEIAEEKSRQVHPLYGHRGQQIIDWLVRSKEWNDKLQRNGGYK